MAGLRTALRLAPRAHLLRPSYSAALGQRSYAVATAAGYGGTPKRRPADDRKPIHEAEEGQEDHAAGIAGFDPNMVGLEKPANISGSYLRVRCSMRTSTRNLTHCWRRTRAINMERMLTSLSQNGDYPDPNLTSALPVKRQHRDPYGDWWDPIERRNYGETVHEDNDIMGVFSTEDYTHFSPAKGAVLLVCHIYRRHETHW